MHVEHKEQRQRRGYEDEEEDEEEKTKNEKKKKKKDHSRVRNDLRAKVLGSPLKGRAPNSQAGSVSTQASNATVSECTQGGTNRCPRTPRLPFLLPFPFPHFLHPFPSRALPPLGLKTPRRECYIFRSRLFKGRTWLRSAHEKNECSVQRGVVRARETREWGGENGNKEPTLAARQERPGRESGEEQRARCCG